MKRRRRKKTANPIIALLLLAVVIGITVFAGRFMLNSFELKKAQEAVTPEKEVKSHNTIFGEEPKAHKNTQDSKTKEMKTEDQSAQSKPQSQEQADAQKQTDSQKQADAQTQPDSQESKEKNQKTQPEQPEQPKEQEKQDEQMPKKQETKRGEQPKEQQQEQANQAFSLSSNYNQDVAAQFSFVTNDPSSIYVMLNKKNSLPEGYKPANLVVPNIDFPFSHDTPKKYMRAEAASALEKLFEAAKLQGHQLYGISGYRSYETQKSLYEMYVKKDGKEAADRYSSKPGYSEHQSGLVMDISSKAGGFDLQESFGELEEGKWVAQNAHKYGFIVRYLKDKVHITGYDYEPWHLRYVGEDVANYMFENNLCYEEFYDIIGVEYNK